MAAVQSSSIDFAGLARRAGPAAADHEHDQRMPDLLPMTSAVANLVSILDLEPIEVNLFRGRSPQQGWQRAFGGQVIGQGLGGACRTVEDIADRPPHLLRASL